MQETARTVWHLTLNQFIGVRVPARKPNQDQQVIRSGGSNSRHALWPHIYRLLGLLCALINPLGSQMSKMESSFVDSQYLPHSPGRLH